MAERLPVAFLAGLISVLTPCVLPLVPGYLSAVSAIEAGRLGERGVGRRVALASLPFVLGFTVVFVVLGAGAAAIGSVLDKRTQTEFAGFLLIVIGLGFVGLLPWPERTFFPGLLAGARGKGSSVLLGAAFAVCAAPCIGAVLGSILVLAGSAGSVARGVVLLIAYSVGLGAAFVLAGVGFTRAMAAFRWLRNRYRALQIVGGATLVALGALLFFERYWWLQVALNRVLESVGLDQI
ncbi:MAG TPA: cytochrome c biogenesis protein CcdA [Gaiellaceae bacterium]|nr:cytochrome c biogenesis protein CcdA [Gaiellaceae bacterium]